jgi:hypothetical protein
MFSVKLKMKYFETKFMEEANQFIAELDPKTIKHGKESNQDLFTYRNER